MSEPDEMAVQRRRLVEAVMVGGLAGLGSEPRATRLSRERIENLVANSHLVSGDKANLVLALALLWHDYLDAAHSLVQEMPGSDASLIHAMMHRREPDYWNSKYWLRRVGSHRVYPAIATRVSGHLDSTQGEALARRLIQKGKWNPDAFVDACEEAAGGRGADLVKPLQEIQRLEFEALLNQLLG